MSKEEVGREIKKVLLGIYGENLSISEAPDSIEWNFDGGLHMCSLVFVGNKYEVKLDKTSICGVIPSFQTAWFEKEAMKAASSGTLKFLESVGLGDPGKLWKSEGGLKFRLEYDSESGSLGWSISCKNGKKYIYKDGICKKLG